VTLGAFRRSSRRLAIMTRAALFSGIYGIHCHFDAAFFHAENLGMTIFAGECLCMKRMAEFDDADTFRLVNEIGLRHRRFGMAFCAIAG
jgi:hypothetical protein